MSLDKALLSDSLLELEALENETRLLLEKVKGKPKPKAGSTKESKPKDKSADEKGESKSKKIKKAKKDKVVETNDTSRGNYDARVTIEVLDDASPDGTPRLDEDSANYKKIQQQKEKLAAKQASEKVFRKLQFDEEKMRVTKGADTFVRTSGLSAGDIEQE
eukprot:gene25417-28729_t